ncbi:MAG TPA: hypothetical protein PKW35_01130, partial [Nannocystaceae bacterium]|nr:hypothetical protein [Nannocystaceae bacterium]
MNHERAALHHLGWLDLCEHLRRGLSSTMARRALDEGLAHEFGEAAPGAPEVAFAAARSGDPLIVRARLDELDALESLFAGAGEAPGEI